MTSAKTSRYPSDPQWTGHCIRLPSLKRLYCFNYGHERDGAPKYHESDFKELVPCSSGVELIELRSTKLCCSYFIAVLRVPKRLETFIYEAGNILAVSLTTQSFFVDEEILTWIQWTRLKTTAIQAALNHHNQHLVRLCLSYEDDFPAQSYSGDEWTPMDLSNFVTLRNLRIAPIYLYGEAVLQIQGDPDDNFAHAPARDMPSQTEIETTRMLLVNALPSSLETLHFEQCCEEPTLRLLTASLQDLLRVKDEHFPSLREIGIHGLRRDCSDGLTLVQDALLTAKDQGLHFTMDEKHGPGMHGERGWDWHEEVNWAECVGYNRGYPVTIVYDNQAAVKSGLSANT